MTAELRFDFAGKLSRADTTPAGGARVSARVARSGVQTYRMADGSTRREYRPADEVFAADALASLRAAPVTIGHPRRVDPSNWRALSAGVVSGEPERVRESDGLEYVRVAVDVNDAEAIAKVDRGELVELSCGYRCDFDPTPGATPSGQKYDGVQRNIRINHVALLGAGQARAGRNARLLLDSADDNVVDVLDDAQWSRHLRSFHMADVKEENDGSITRDGVTFRDWQKDEAGNIVIQDSDIPDDVRAAVASIPEPFWSEVQRREHEIENHMWHLQMSHLHGTRIK